MALEKELAAFNRNLPKLKTEHEGKFVDPCTAAR